MLKYSLLLCAWLFSLYPALNYAEKPSELTLVTQNLNRFFDDKDDGIKEKVLSSSQYQRRLDQLVAKIVAEYDKADLLAFQEVENIKVLRDISQQLKRKHRIAYVPVLVEGNDTAGIDVGYLVKDSWQIKSITPIFKNKTYNRQGAKLFSRPPLVIEICSIKCFTVMNLHLRSMRGLRSKQKGHRIAIKRQRQSESIAGWIQKFQNKNPDSRLIVAGDFNALTPSDPYVDSVGTILGSPDRKRPRLKSPDLVSKDLINITKRVKQRDRYSFKYKGKKQQLDYILVSSKLAGQIKSIHFGEINYRFSDHAAVLATFSLH